MSLFRCCQTKLGYWKKYFSRRRRLFTHHWTETHREEKMSSQGSGEDTTFLDMLASVVGDETPAGPSSLQRQSSSSSLDLTALFAMDDIPATPSQPAAPRGNSNENSNSRQRMLQHQQLHQQQIQQQMQQQQTPQQRIIAHPLSAILAQLPPDRHPAFMAIYQQFHVNRSLVDIPFSLAHALVAEQTDLSGSHALQSQRTVFAINSVLTTK